MKVLYVAVFLFTVHTLGVCGQQETYPDVQKKLQQLSRAMETLRGSSIPPPTTAQPTPVVQHHKCDCKVNWTSVPMTSIGSSNLTQNGTFIYNIPSVIPSSAKEVLVLADVRLGDTGLRDCVQYIKIYTRESQK